MFIIYHLMQNCFIHLSKRYGTKRKLIKIPRLTTYFLLVLISVNSSYSLPIVHYQNSNFVNIDSDSSYQDSLPRVKASVADIFLNPELNKFVKSLINNYDNDADQQLDMKELQLMLKNPRILKACQNILDKTPRKLLKAYAPFTATIKASTSKAPEIMFGRNDNSKWERRRKMQDRFKFKRKPEKKFDDEYIFSYDKQNSVRSRNSDPILDIKSKMGDFNFG